MPTVPILSRKEASICRTKLLVIPLYAPTSTSLGQVVPHDGLPSMENTVCLIKTAGTTNRTRSDYKLTLSSVFTKKDISTNMQYSVLGNDNKDIFLSDITARYQFKKASLELIANNITNQKEYIIEEISNLIESRTIYALRPREFMIKLSWVM